MGMPTVPNITPIIDLDRDDIINLLLISIALEEMSLAHIINAEAKKLQKVVSDQNTTFEDLLNINKTIERNFRNIIKKEMLLQYKFEDVLDLIELEEDDDEV